MTPPPSPAKNPSESAPPSAALLAEQAIRAAARQHLVHAALFLYGSRARGDCHRRSDFDLAWLPRQGFHPREIARFRQTLEESPDIIFPIDLIDLTEASPPLAERIRQEGIPWKD